MRTPRTLLGLLACCALGACAKGQPCPTGRCEDDATASASVPDASARVVDPEQACAMQSTRATPGIDKQVDIVFVIDNSGSMTEEITAIRSNINRNFAELIAESGVDFRVVMVSLFGSDGTKVCVDPPLAGATCAAGLEASTSDVFFHYNMEIDSANSLCQLLAAFDRPDAEARAPYGYRQWLRPEAEKVFVVFTDDSAGCAYQVAGGGALQFGTNGEDPYAVALSFHETLLALSPDQFGDKKNARYTFYSIVGLAPSVPSTDPWFPYQDLVTDTCATAPSAGVVYQALSVITDALRYPVCEGVGFDAIFRVLARSVVEAAKADCSFELPQAPEGQSIARSSINLEYRPGDGSEAQRFEQVSDVSQCRKDAFYASEARLDLCPDTCALVEGDRNAEIEVLYGCNAAVQ